MQNGPWNFMPLFTFFQPTTQDFEALVLLNLVLIICELPHVFQKVVAFLSNISSIKALSLKHIYPPKKQKVIIN
jgi:hypothetical protein